MNCETTDLDPKKILKTSIYKYQILIWDYTDQRPILRRLKKIAIQWIALSGLRTTDPVNSANFKVANKWAAVYVEPYLTPCTSFILGLLIFK